MKYGPTHLHPLSKLLMLAILCLHQRVHGVDSFTNGGAFHPRKQRTSLFPALFRNSNLNAVNVNVNVNALRTRKNMDVSANQRHFHMNMVATSSALGDDGDDPQLSLRGGGDGECMDDHTNTDADANAESNVNTNTNTNNDQEESKDIMDISTAMTQNMTATEIETETMKVAQLTTSSEPEPNPTLSSTENKPRIKVWPCGDELDRKLMKIALPCIANFAINPLVGAVDLFWINRMRNTLAVAGQAAANQIFSSAFWLTSFLPSVTATIVAKEYAKGSEEGVQDSICLALAIGAFVAIIGSGLVLTKSDALLGGVLKSGAPAREFAKPYLMIRGFAFLPSLFSLIGFSAFRGTMDTVTPLKISLFANLLNAVLDPILIFKAKMGVSGAALATLGAETASAVIFFVMMLKRSMIVPSKLFRAPRLKQVIPLLKGGAALQLRNVALNIAFLAVTRVTQSIDNTGVSASAHAMAIQTFQIGGIVLLALSTVAQFVIPSEMVEKVDEETGEVRGGITAARATVDRLMSWGLILGCVLGSLQVILIPFLAKASPMEEVRQAARVPSLLASLYQCVNGLVFIGEGVMVGTGSFLQLSLSTIVATLGILLALNKLPQQFGLTGVWMSFGVFNGLRLLGVFIHQRVHGPLADRGTLKHKKE